jgi:hypothetical protein
VPRSAKVAKAKRTDATLRLRLLEFNDTKVKKGSAPKPKYIAPGSLDRRATRMQHGRFATIIYHRYSFLGEPRRET